MAYIIQITRLIVLTGSIMATLQVNGIAQPSSTPCPYRPVVMLHGFLGAGDNYNPMAAHLVSMGYCPQYLHTYDWNTLARDANEVKRLDSTIDAILKKTGAKQVDLVGHSAGGGVAYSYLADSVRSLKVAKYAHIGSRAMSGPAGYNGHVPTLNIYSYADMAVKGADIAGATNIAFSFFDHFALVAADSTAMRVFLFFADGAKAGQGTLASHTGNVLLRVIQMGDNNPEAGAILTWQALDIVSGSPVGTQGVGKTDASGQLTLTGILPNRPYWLLCTPLSGRPVAYFIPGLLQATLPVYLRTLPNTGMVRMLLGGIPQNEDAAAWVLFSSKSAIISGEHSLQLDADVLNTEAITPAKKTVVALFLYDNGDKQSSLQTIGAFGAAPFMNGVDYYLPVSAKTANLSWNGSVYTVPLMASAKAVTVVVLN